VRSGGDALLRGEPGGWEQWSADTKITALTLALHEATMR
jgi:hypothetical protein